MPPVKKVIWSYIIGRILQFVRGPCTYEQCLKAKPKISCSLWSPRHAVLPPGMGATEMQVIKGIPYHCCGNASCGQGWPTKCIKSCMCCLQHEGNLPKVPLHLRLSTASMDLLHVDFTSIEMTMEPKRLPKVTNVLVFQDHFTKHVMVYVRTDQTTKTVAKL